MKQTAVVILLLSCFYSWGQSDYPSLRMVKKLFKESEEKYGLTNVWLACNRDSSYFKEDTILLYNHLNYAYHSNSCCRFVKWQFQNRSSITFSQTQMCTEPPVGTLFGYRKIKLTEQKNKIQLQVISLDKQADKFIVIAVTKKELWNGGDHSTVLTLARQRN